MSIELNWAHDFHSNYQDRGKNKVRSWAFWPIRGEYYQKWPIRGRHLTSGLGPRGCPTPPTCRTPWGRSQAPRCLPCTAPGQKVLTNQSRVLTELANQSPAKHFTFECFCGILSEPNTASWCLRSTWNIFNSFRLKYCFNVKDWSQSGSPLQDVIYLHTHD